MSEEEMKAIKYLEEERAYAHKLDNRKIISIITIALKLIRNRQKELNNLKEIEKSHQEENGKLRVELEQVERKVEEYRIGWCNTGEELEQEKEKNKLSDKEKEIINSYRMLVEETGREDWIICNPKTMWCNYFVSKETIMQEIKNIEKRMETATNSTEYQKLHCAEEYLRGLLWEV